MRRKPFTILTNFVVGLCLVAAIIVFALGPSYRTGACLFVILLQAANLLLNARCIKGRSVSRKTRILQAAILLLSLFILAIVAASLLYC